MNPALLVQIVRILINCRLIWALTFFGLTQEYRLQMHKVIFSMIYHGKGGFTFQDLYNMPVFLRGFYLKEMNDAVEKHNAEMEKAMKKSR